MENRRFANFWNNCRAISVLRLSFVMPAGIGPRFIRLLEKHRVCWVWADTSPLNERNLAPFEFLPRTTDFLYLRLLGDYATKYDRDGGARPSLRKTALETRSGARKLVAQNRAASGRDAERLDIREQPLRRLRAGNLSATRQSSRLRTAAAIRSRETVVSEQTAIQLDLFVADGRLSSAEVGAALSLTNLRSPQNRLQFFRNPDRAIWLLTTLDQRGKQSRQRQSRAIQRVAEAVLPLAHL